MSIDIEIGVTTSPINAIDKNFTNVRSVTGTLIHPCTIDAPVIKISGGYISANYIKGLFNRNYYIESQTLEKGFNYLHCISDPVSSFPQYGTSQYVSRCETEYNLSIPDNLLPLAIENLPHTEKAGAFGVSSEYIILGVTNYDYKPKYNIQVNHNDTQDEEHIY